MFSERKVDVETGPVEDRAPAAFGRFDATAHDLPGVVGEAWLEYRVEGDAPDVLARFSDRIYAEIDVRVLEALETVIGRRLTGFRQVKREPHPRAATLDDLLAIGRPVESAGIALRQTRGDPVWKKMRIGIHAEPGTAPCRMGVHVNQARQKQGVGVVEIQTRGSFDVRDRLRQSGRPLRRRRPGRPDRCRRRIHARLKSEGHSLRLFRTSIVPFRWKKWLGYVRQIGGSGTHAGIPRRSGSSVARVQTHSANLYSAAPSTRALDRDIHQRCSGRHRDRGLLFGPFGVFD